MKSATKDVVLVEASKQADSTPDAHETRSKSLLVSFAEVPDPRTRACRYPWDELMFTALCGVCSGADDWVGVVDWATLKLIPIDGKSVRRSHNGQSRMAHLVSAWHTKQGLVLAQVKTAAKSVEITAIPELLDCERSPVSASPNLPEIKLKGGVSAFPEHLSISVR